MSARLFQKSLLLHASNFWGGEGNVDPIQSAFVPKFSTHNNILHTHKIINKLNNVKGKKAWVTLKLHMENAYDRVNGTFYLIYCIYLGSISNWQN